MEAAIEFLRQAAYQGGKTPVMWLQEICVKEGCGIRYQERDLRASVSAPPMFELTAMVTGWGVERKDFTATGVKSNKKDAKQEAALNMMFKLSITPKDLAGMQSNKGKSPFSRSVDITDGSTAQGGSSPMTASPAVGTPAVPCTATSAVQPDVVMTSPSQIDPSMVSGTCCQQLIDLCEKRGLTLHEYKLVKEEGPPHCKTFTMRCTVSGINGSTEEVEASAQKKQKAKHLAAAKMLERLQDVGMQSNLEDLAKLVADSPVTNDMVARIVCKEKTKCAELFSHAHHRYFTLVGDAMVKLRERDVASIPVDTDEPVALLSAIAAEENLKVQYTDVPERGANGFRQFYCEVSYPPEITGQPSVFIGEGLDETYAKRASALNALVFLKEVSTP